MELIIEKNVFLIFWAPILLHPKAVTNMKNSLIRAGQLLLYKFCDMRCNVLFSHVKNRVLKIILGSKVKTNMKERCSID